MPVSVASYDFPSALVLNKQQAHFAVCVPSHHTSPMSGVILNATNSRSLAAFTVFCSCRNMIV